MEHLSVKRMQMFAQSSMHLPFVSIDVGPRPSIGPPVGCGDPTLWAANLRLTISAAPSMGAQRGEHMESSMHISLI